MKDSKLIKILKTFSKKEWKEFEKFADSPYFNRGRNYGPFLKALKKFYPSFDSEKLTRESIYDVLYPGKKYKDAVMFTITSGLYSMAEEFLIQIDAASNQFTKGMNLLRQLSARNIDGIHNKALEAIENKLQTEKAGKGIFEQLALLETQKIRHSMKGNFEKNFAENIPRRGDYHIFSFIFILLNEVRNLIVLKDDYNITVKKDLSHQVYKALDFKKLADYADNYYPKLSPVIKTVIDCYVASLTTDDIYFEAKKNMLKYYSLFDNSLLRELFVIMEGGVSIRLLSGNREFVKEWHELHRISVERGLYTYNNVNYIHPLIAHNMLNIAFWNREYGWIESFINNHQNLFPNEFKNYLVSIGNVYLHLSRKEFTEALKLLTTIDDKLIPFKRRVRILLLNIYYELNEFELALNALDSFRHFIEYNKDRYEDKFKYIKLIFIPIYEQLLKHRFGNYEINLKQLKKTLLDQPPTQIFDWLLEKLEELDAK